jgi:hypothetical protein
MEAALHEFPWLFVKKKVIERQTSESWRQTLRRKNEKEKTGTLLRAIASAHIKKH